MSAGAVRWALHVQGPAPGERLVLIALADMAKDATMQCWPGVKHVARVTGYSERTVQGAIAELVSKGLIMAEDRTGTSNLYTLLSSRQGGAVSAGEGGAENAGVAGGANSAPLLETAGVRLAKTPSSPADSAPKPRVPTSTGNYPSSQSELSLPSPELQKLRVVAGRHVQKSLEDMVTIWNEICGDVLPRALRRIPSSRQAALRRTLAEDMGNSIDEWRAFCRRVRASPFLTKNRSDSTFRATIDWCIDETKGNACKILEGNFDPVTAAPADRRAKAAVGGI